MSENNYLVSIITVVYNGAKTIERTIQSVLGQSYKNIEYIIIDGLSSDGTQEIVEKYIDSIAYFVSEKDNGLYNAMNKGIQHATGDIIGIINSDDWYTDDAVEKVVDCFSNNEVELVYGKDIYVYPDGREELNQVLPLETIWYQMSLPHPTVFVKKSIYEKFGVFNEEYKIGADYDLMLRLYNKQVKFGFIDDVLAYFRTGGLSTKKLKTCVEEAKDISLKYIKFCPNIKETMKKIEERYKWYTFSVEIEERGSVLKELLCAYFKEPVLQLVIFGTGSWGGKCYQILKSTKINVDLFVDNDSSKWNQMFHGIRIADPKELCNREVHVLIAVKESGDQIKKQLSNLCNSELTCVSIKELEALFFELAEY